MKYKISTPCADEYREVVFTVENGIVTDSDPARFSDFHGRKWNEVDLNFISVWKLWSSMEQDNVYPCIEELPEGSAKKHTRESLIAFEERIRLAWEAGELPSLIHLCGGNEGQLIDIFSEVQERDWIFVSHRAHYHCLLKGMPEAELEANIRADRSMFCFSEKYRIYQSAILGGCCGIATGVARAIKDAGGRERVWCFLGDGAADNGHLYEAAMYATGHDLPISFIIENNRKQVDTDIETRRGPGHLRFALYAPCVREYEYTPRWPHAGSGCAHQITFKRTTPL